MRPNASDDSPELLVEDNGPVRRIVFNRPRVHNAQSPSMLRALDLALLDTAGAARSACRILILEGAGKSFCSGHDLRAITDDDEYARNASSAEGRYWQELSLFARPVRRFRELPIPTVCRVQGHCIAAGLMFAASADFVVAADDARFRSPVIASQAVNDAEVPSLAWRIGERRTKQMLWLDETLSAAEAREAGLVNWVVPLAELDRRVDEVVRRLLEITPEVLAISKSTFQFMAERQGERDVDRFHFLAHQFSHQTDEARRRLAERVRVGTDPTPGAREE